MQKETEIAPGSAGSSESNSVVTAGDSLMAEKPLHKLIPSKGSSGGIPFSVSMTLNASLPFDPDRFKVAFSLLKLFQPPQDLFLFFTLFFSLFAQHKIKSVSVKIQSF